MTTLAEEMFALSSPRTARRPAIGRAAAVTAVTAVALFALSLFSGTRALATVDDENEDALYANVELVYVEATPEELAEADAEPAVVVTARRSR